MNQHCKYAKQNRMLIMIQFKNTFKIFLGKIKNWKKPGENFNYGFKGFQIIL